MTIQIERSRGEIVVTFKTEGQGDSDALKAATLTALKKGFTLEHVLEELEAKGYGVVEE